MQLQKEIFDETFIQLNLKGGQLHTQLLQVEALVLKGKLKGQTLPLKCQWFNVTKSNDFIEIEEVSGQFYQPCIQDVDTKIMVQAIPILDQEYEGMPICKETNFLKIDQQILDQVKTAFDQNYLEVVCKLESASGNLPKTFDHIQMPQEVQITLSESLISIFISSKNIIEEFKEGELRIIKKSNNQLELGFPQCKLLVATANNIIRDVIFQFFKTIKGKSIDHSQLYATITDYKQKLQFQESELNNLNEQIKQLKQKLKDSQLLQQQQQKKIDQYDKLQQQLVNKENELQQQKANFEKLEGKTQFYQQEIKVLKSSVVTLENQSKKQQIELEEFKKIQHQNQDEIREMFYRDKLDNLRIQNEKCIKENQQWQLLNDQLLKEINVIQHSLKQQNEEKETQQNELNALRKKYESLTIEVNKQESNPISEILDNKKFNVDEEESKNEIIRLKQTIINLESTLKSMRMNYEQDMLKIVNGKAFIKQNHTQEMQLLQKLANSLAESLTDKELALQNQRNINRELLIRMQEQNK